MNGIASGDDVRNVTAWSCCKANCPERCSVGYCRSEVSEGNGRGSEADEPAATALSCSIVAQEKLLDTSNLAGRQGGRRLRSTPVLYSHDRRTQRPGWLCRLHEVGATAL
jgi:hypothetical protein